MNLPITDRRSFLAGTTAFAASAITAPAVLRAQGKTLRVLTWEGYADPAWLEPFKAATGADVAIVYVGAADEMFAKMVGSKGADFDILAVDTSAFARYIDAGLLMPLDMKKLPRAANLATEFRDVKEVRRDEKIYGVPFAWGSLPLVYDADAFATPPTSWSVMWDEQYAQQMLALDDANNSVVYAAIALGFPDPYNLSDAQLAAVKGKLIAQKKLLLSYYAGFDDGVNLFAQNGIKLMFSMGEPQVGALKKKGVNAALAIPSEGAIGWLDCWEISAGAKDVDLAHAWIDACLDSGTGKALSAKSGYGNTTNLDANVAAGLTYGDQLKWLLTPESFDKRVALWNEVKAS